MEVCGDSFGAMLYAVRARRGWTQKEAATRSQLTRDYYSHLENCRKQPPSWQAVERIASALELSEQESRRLVSLAIVDRHLTHKLAGRLSPDVLHIFTRIIEQADLITPETAHRIDTAITKELNM